MLLELQEHQLKTFHCAYKELKRECGDACYSAFASFHCAYKELKLFSGLLISILTFPFIAPIRN